MSSFKEKNIWNFSIWKISDNQWLGTVKKSWKELHKFIWVIKRKVEMQMEMEMHYNRLHWLQLISFIKEICSSLLRLPRSNYARTRPGRNSSCCGSRSQFSRQVLQMRGNAIILMNY